MKPCYVYSQLHKGLLIGIKTSAQSFTYQILGHSSNCESKNHYHTIEAALTAGVAEAEKVFTGSLVSMLAVAAKRSPQQQLKTGLQDGTMHLMMELRLTKYKG